MKKYTCHGRGIKSSKWITYHGDTYINNNDRIITVPIVAIMYR